MAKGRDIVAVDGDGSVRLSVNPEVLYTDQHKNETTGNYREFCPNIVNVVQISIARYRAINVDGTLEVLYKT